MNRRTFGLSALASLMVGRQALRAQERAASPPAPGEALRSFTLPLASGGNREWRPGRVTVLTFCAFWCDTWKTQSVRLRSARRALAGLPVEFLFLSVDGRWVEKGQTEAGGEVLVDAGGGLTASLGIRAVPYTVLVGHDGRIRWSARGIIRSEDVVREARGELAGKAAETGVVYLTFDDFPAPAGDEALLDLLRAEGVATTFFCIGRNVAAQSALVRRAAAEGHSLQLHAWDHDARNPQLDRCREALEQAGTPRPTLYRPPGQAKIVRLAGGTLGNPSVNPYDFTRPGVAELALRVLPAVKHGCVVLLHAGVGETREALPPLLRGLRAHGLACAALR